MTPKRRRAGPEGSDSNIRLAKLNPDRDSRELFARLMKDSERGHIVGAVVIALCRHRGHPPKHYFVSLSGRAKTSPTYALGATRACMSILSDLARKEAGLTE